MSACKRIRPGVQGCAEFALRRMLPAFTDHPEVEIAAIANRHPSAAREAAACHGGTPWPGYEQLLTLPGLDAVYIPLPNPTAERAARAIGRQSCSCPTPTVPWLDASAAIPVSSALRTRRSEEP
ncbi:Gfo/Idh/MocA family oxidoreductase [Streptomyces sp. NPDC006552]|uniref:Gfo/Idh/MocA family oxidoreductase n=1 Tax=Streptomyces sp. NPDC006552 TaxID=3157179 RepID=UPI0033AFCC8B